MEQSGRPRRRGLLWVTEPLAELPPVPVGSFATSVISGQPTLPPGEKGLESEVQKVSHRAWGKGQIRRVPLQWGEAATVRAAVIDLRLHDQLGDVTCLLPKLNVEQAKTTGRQRPSARTVQRF